MMGEPYDIELEKFFETNEHCLMREFVELPQIQELFNEYVTECYDEHCERYKKGGRYELDPGRNI